MLKIEEDTILTPASPTDVKLGQCFQCGRIRNKTTRKNMLLVYQMDLIRPRKDCLQ